MPSFIILGRYCAFTNILLFELTEHQRTSFYWALSHNCSILVGGKKCNNSRALVSLHCQMDTGELIIIMILHEYDILINFRRQVGVVREMKRQELSAKELRETKALGDFAE